MKSALLACGGRPGHKPEKCARIFAPFLEENGYGEDAGRGWDAVGEQVGGR